jgi:hypothetical protein
MRERQLEAALIERLVEIEAESAVQGSSPLDAYSSQKRR